MRTRLSVFTTVAAILLSSTTPALAQKPVIFFDHGKLVRVKPGTKRVLYVKPQGTRQCPSGMCQTRQTVSAGDLLVPRSIHSVPSTSKVIAETQWLEVEVPDPQRYATSVYLRVSDVVEEPETRQPLDAWHGEWQRREASITIKPSLRPDVFTVEGTATWGAYDPDRVARGGINLGEIRGEFEVMGSMGGFAMTASGNQPFIGGSATDCRVRFRLLGPYMLVEDNYSCGGMNVSFSGTYVKKKRTPRRKGR